MRLLFLSDTQLGGGARYGTAEVPRLADHARTLEVVSTLCVEAAIDLLVFCGDAFQHRKPGVDELLVFGRFLDDLPVPFVLVAGNHDVRGPAYLPSVLDLFGARGETTFVTPGAKQLSEDLGLAFLPWSHPGPMRAARAGASALEQAETLLKIADGLHDRVATLPTRVLVTHHALTGMSLPTGLSTGELVGEVVLDTQALLAQGWRAVVAGHVHRHDVVFRDHPDGGCAVSIGSPWVNDFGEADLPHGVLVFDTADEVFEHVPLAGRRFVTIDLDDRPLDSWAHEGIEEAVVRVRITCTDEAARSVDLDGIRRGLLDAGAHRVHSIALKVERAVRLRAEGMDEDTGPLAALDQWLIAVGEGPREGERLRDLTRSLLEQEV